MLYTAIIDYKGSTFVRQIKSVDLLKDGYVWKAASALEDVGIVRGVFLSLFNDFLNENYDVVGVDGYVNVWCTSTLHNDDLALIHIIKTIS